MTRDEDIEYILIDPPVTPYSPKEDILAWIEKLKTLPTLPEVKEAIAEANKYIKIKDELDK